MTGYGGAQRDGSHRRDRQHPGVPQDEQIAYHDLVAKPITELPENSTGLSAVRHIVEDVILEG